MRKYSCRDLCEYKNISRYGSGKDFKAGKLNPR